jgi:hypothetical protein
MRNFLKAIAFSIAHSQAEACATKTILLSHPCCLPWLCRLLIAAPSPVLHRVKAVRRRRKTKAQHRARREVRRIPETASIHLGTTLPAPQGLG